MDYKEKLIFILNSKDLSEGQKAKLDEIFPELQESEDERIRKALIRVIKRYAEGYENVEAGLSVSDAIAWLEKQGEQKSAWSEEDKDIIEWLIGYLEYQIMNATIPEEKNNCLGAISFLKSLKPDKN